MKWPVRRCKLTYEVAEELLLRVSTWWHKFVTPVQGREFRSANNEILIPQAQVTSFGNRVKRGGVFQDLPIDPTRPANFISFICFFCFLFLFLFFSAYLTESEWIINSIFHFSVFLTTTTGTASCQISLFIQRQCEMCRTGGYHCWLLRFILRSAWSLLRFYMVCHLVIFLTLSR